MRFPEAIRRRWQVWQNDHRIQRVRREVSAHSQITQNQSPVVVFNASSRLTGLSQNAAFSILTSWGLRLAGVPTMHIVCRAGMSRCVMGTAWNLNSEQASRHGKNNVRARMPCRSCNAQSRILHGEDEVYWFEYQADERLLKSIHNLNIDELNTFEYDSPVALHNPTETTGNQQNQPIKIPLGKLVLPSLRWALRRYTLTDDEDTRFLYREFILSAYHVAHEFTTLIHKTKPVAAVIFNGLMFPEAAARWVAEQCGVRVVMHEVCFQRFSAFFSDEEATAYPIHIPEVFELTLEQNERLDAYLEKRFQGKFSMAGIRFWPEMRGLDEELLKKIKQFKQVVPVFTNVIYDTSQIHADKVFTNMFEWLDLVLKISREHPETLFVLRAHPDEMRPGTAKQSRETVQEWVYKNKIRELPNVVFIDSQEYISSYELIQRAKFSMVYNSSIGMEAVLLGKPVLCGGKARYTQYPIVFFPQTPQAYQEMAENFLVAEKIDLPEEFLRNARRFLYYQLYRVSLGFEDFIEDGPRQGFVQLKNFSWKALCSENSPTMNVIVDGILHQSGFTKEE